MPNFMANGVSTAAAAPVTALTVIGSTTCRPKIYDVIVGSPATPADAQLTIQLRRFTAAGTTAASPPTPEPLEGGGQAAVATCGHTHSAEPTYAGVGLVIPVHQRGTFRWVARQGGEISAPMAAANGIGVVKTAATTGTPQIHATVMWNE